MSYLPDDAERRAQEYAAKKSLQLVDRLGFGVHGMVWATNCESAVKAHSLDAPHYERERDIYLRLFQNSLTSLIGFSVPQLVDFDNKLKVLEIGVVRPPFVLDFAGAYLDEEPDFSPEVWAEWEAAKQEQFGDDWPHAKAVVAALKRYGIFMSDVTPNNIRIR